MMAALKTIVNVKTNVTVDVLNCCFLCSVISGQCLK